MVRFRRASSLAVVTALFGAEARSEVAWTEVTTVSGSNPSLAARPGGGVHVVVADDSVRHVELDAAGTIVGDDLIPGTSGAADGYSFGPAVGVGAGAIHVAFAKSLGNWMLTGHHVAKNASGWGTVTDLQPSTERGYAPSVAVDAAGVAHVLFGAATSTPFGVANYYRVDAGSVTQSHPALIEWRADDRTAIVTGPSNAVIAFAGRPSPSGYIALASSTSGGATFSAQAEIEPPNVGTQRVGQPHAVVDAAGVVHLVFGAGDDSSTPCNCAVHYAVLDGTSAKQMSVVSPAAALEHWHLSLGISRLALLDSGQRVVTWQRHAGDDSAAPVSASSSSDGTSWSAPKSVASDCGGSEGRNTIDMVASGSTVWLACPKGSTTRIFRGIESATVPCSPVSPFSAPSVTPASGSGPAQSFTTRLSHCEGAGAFRIMQLRVTKLVDTAEPAVAPSFEAGAFHLDAASCAPGEAKTLTSTYGTLDCASSSVVENGNELSVTFALAFDVAKFSGERGLFVDAKGGSVSPEPRLGWTEVGKFTVSATSSGTGGATGSGGGAGSSGVPNGGGVTEEDDSGCGCATVGSKARAELTLLLTAVAFGLWAGGRRRTRP